MRLNNKGFAITAVLYGLLILFAILVSSYLLVLSAKKDRIDILVNEIESEYKGEEEIENLSPINLKEHITNLYTNANKTTVTNNGIVYNYAPTVRLMNDRFGSNEVDANSGNIRYYGADDTDLKNYIYFNCSDYSNQSDSTCEKWRIIGIVDGKVKLIRNESIGNLAWDDNEINWSTSTLNAYLNEDHYDSLNSKNNKTIGLISKSTYYLGGYETSELYSNQIYGYERTNEEGRTILSGNPFTEETNIGLMYASDYGYAADFGECSSNLYNYYAGECSGNDWLYHSTEEWLITPNALGGYAWFVQLYGSVEFYGNVCSGFNDCYALVVRPVLYLDSELSIESDGDGSSTNPYRIHVK